MASDFHSGPLSVIIPLGIFGAIAFLWFLAPAFRVLFNNYRHGDKDYHRLNTFLLAYFTVRVIYFFVIFGSFHTELTIFTGLIGLSISVNGGMRRPAPAKARAQPCLPAVPAAQFGKGLSWRLRDSADNTASHCRITPLPLHSGPA